MVSYLLIVLGISIIVSGITYNITSDLVDSFVSALSITFSHDSKFTMDQDSIDTGNLLMTLFKYCLIPILFVLGYFAWTMAQKPVRPW